jgi:Uma2 family endonuclease
VSRAAIADPRSTTHVEHRRPRFLIEVKSPSDTLKKRQENSDEYIANGCKLAWVQ